MKKSVFFYGIVAALFYNCSENSKSIQFIPLTEKDFNYTADSSFMPPTGKEVDARRRWFDSCMGMSFPANAFFMRTKDTFTIGCIVNRKTMKIVRNFDYRDYTRDELIPTLNVVTKPCYFKMPFPVRFDSLFRSKTNLKLSGVDENINRELNEVIHSSENNEIESGGWLLLEATDALGKILDTAKDSKKLAYKYELLQPDNMVLIRSASITNITMYIHTQKPISNKLKNVLLQKPVAKEESKSLQPQLFFVNDNLIELNFTGYFQVLGQFMKCELR
jgi:hypothetical protein